MIRFDEFPWLPKTFRAREHVHMDQAMFSRYPIESMIRERLSRLIAQEVVKEHLKKTENGPVRLVTYDLEVYVLTPEELSRLVMEYAWKLEMMRPIVPPMPPMPKE